MPVTLKRSRNSRSSSRTQTTRAIIEPQLECSADTCSRTADASQPTCHRLCVPLYVMLSAMMVLLLACDTFLVSYHHGRADRKDNSVELPSKSHNRALILIFATSWVARAQSDAVSNSVSRASETRPAIEHALGFSPPTPSDPLIKKRLG